MSRFDTRGILWPKWMERLWTKERGVEPSVGQLLYSLAIARQPRLIVETGLFRGTGSTPWLAWAAQEIGSLHFAIDIDFAACEAAAAMLERRNWLFEEGGCVGTIVTHIDALNFISQVPDHSIDFLFLDDDHTTTHVKQEIEAYMPKMRLGSAMFFHDVIGTGPDFEIWETIKYYGGIRLANRAYNYPENAPFGGLGMISIDDTDRNGLYPLAPYLQIPHRPGIESKRYG